MDHQPTEKRRVLQQTLSGDSPVVLVVDDDRPARYSVTRTLRVYGFTVIEASTGQEALDLSASALPDLILLDVNLPDIHGFEVARRLKKAESTCLTPILQLSASAISPRDREQGLSAGADAYLVQPVEPDELVANIRALLRLRAVEATLQRTTAMLAAVIDSSPLGIAVFDGDGTVMRWNPAAERLFGVRAPDVEGRLPPVDLLPPELASRTLADWIASVHLPIEYRYQRAEDATIDVAMFGAPLSRTGGYVAVFENVSTRKHLERERATWLARERDARREAEAANRLKDEFLATLSHELRTPLNAILGWFQILRHSSDVDKRERALDVIERNAHAQQQIIDDILQVSQIIRGQLRLDIQSVDLGRAVENAIEAVRPTAVAKRQTLEVSIPPTPIVVSADPARLQQMLWNLLSNATKYTKRDGEIAVRVAHGPSEVDISVTDNGIGIAPDLLPYIFERFRQGETGPTREYGGLGLGLAIVRHLADMHGGSIRATSKGIGSGACFTLSLPLAAVEQPS